jgi:hypothetical protein
MGGARWWLEIEETNCPLSLYLRFSVNFLIFSKLVAL